MTRPRCRGEAGQVAGLEAVAFGMLLLVIGVLIIGNAWGVIDAKTAAGEAAREAARAFATAPVSTDAQADALARQTALDTLHQAGWSRSDITVVRTAGAFVRCAVVTYRVTIPVPVFRLPWLRSRTSAFSASASDSEQVDPYRSGVPGATGAVCVDAGA